MHSARSEDFVGLDCLPAVLVVRLPPTLLVPLLIHKAETPRKLRMATQNQGFMPHIVPLHSVV